MEKRIITIGRQFGSNGRHIGKLLADKLGYTYYDKELINKAAKNSGICEELLESMDEKPSKSFIYSLVMDPYAFGFANAGLNNMPLNQQAFKAIYDTIQEISEKEKCVIVGRCADYVLRQREDVARVFVYAEMSKRIQTVSNRYDISEDKARERIQKEDKSRASYYNFYTSKKWGSMDSYDICINSGLMKTNQTVDLLNNIITSMV